MIALAALLIAVILLFAWLHGEYVGARHEAKLHEMRDAALAAQREIDRLREPTHHQRSRAQLVPVDQPTAQIFNLPQPPDAA